MFDHLGLQVTDLAKSIRFYTAALSGLAVLCMGGVNAAIVVTVLLLRCPLLLLRLHLLILLLLLSALLLLLPVSRRMSLDDALGLHADLAPWQRGSAAFGLALAIPATGNRLAYAAGAGFAILGLIFTLVLISNADSRAAAPASPKSAA